jgi:hypothetical protein
MDDSEKNANREKDMKPIDQGIFNDPSVKELGNVVMYLTKAKEWRWMCLTAGTTGVHQFSRPFTPVDDWAIPEKPFIIFKERRNE